jgi:hypothetical protein
MYILLFLFGVFYISVLNDILSLRSRWCKYLVIYLLLHLTLTTIYIWLRISMISGCPFYFVILRNASAVCRSITCYLLICYYSLHFEFWISNIIYMSTLLFNFVPVLKCSCFYVGLHHWTSEAGEESWGHVKG